MRYRPIPLNTTGDQLARRVFSLARGVGRLLCRFRTKLATIAVAVLAAMLAMHVVFGANGMVVYQKKKVEFHSLRKDVDQLQRENQLLSDQIKALKTDPNAIEKEAREQLHYARPGEIVYLTPDPPKPNTPPPSAAAKK